MNAMRTSETPSRLEDLMVEELQAKVDHLQEIVCLLLVKNETMRLALMTERPAIDSRQHVLHLNAL